MRSYRNDIFLAAALLLLGGAMALCLHLTRESGGYVSVQINGEPVMELFLSEDVRIVLGDGAHTNTLVIENGSARVTEASCPDRICVSRGAVRFSGESIVCLPHKLVVTVEGGRTSDVDATTG